MKNTQSIDCLMAAHDTYSASDAARDDICLDKLDQALADTFPASDAIAL